MEFGDFKVVVSNAPDQHLTRSDYLFFLPRRVKGNHHARQHDADHGRYTPQKAGRLSSLKETKNEGAELHQPEHRVQQAECCGQFPAIIGRNRGMTVAKTERFPNAATPLR